jgi:hypothetical protein
VFCFFGSDGPVLVFFIGIHKPVRFFPVLDVYDFRRKSVGPGFSAIADRIGLSLLITGKREELQVTKKEVWFKKY